MNQILNHPFWGTHALLIARLLMGGLFLLAGLQKLQAIDGTAGYIASMGLPMPLIIAWAVTALEITAGIAIIVGKYFKEAALVLAVFVVLANFIFHSPSSWGENPMQQVSFMKNLAIIAGLLFMTAHGSGNTWKLNV